MKTCGHKIETSTVPTPAQIRWRIKAGNESIEMAQRPWLHQRDPVPGECEVCRSLGRPAILNGRPIEYVLREDRTA